MSSVAEVERDLMLECIRAGISRVKATGKVFGRPSALTLDQQQKVIERILAGDTTAAIARDLSTIRQTIMRLRTKLRTSSI